MRGKRNLNHCHFPRKGCDTRGNMKKLKFTPKSNNPVYRPIVWLKGFKRRVRRPQPRIESFGYRAPDACINLTVMSFNIRRGTAEDGRNHWIYRRSLVREVLDQYRPDVLGLQEALDFQISEISAMLPGYESVGIGNPGRSKALHNVIFYDAARFALLEEGAFWFSDTPDIPGSRGWGNIIPRTCTWARLMEKASGQAFYLYNTHLDHISQRARKKSVVFLIEHIHARPFPDPFILAGDLNARERSAPIQYLKGKRLLKMRYKGRVMNPDPLMDTFRVRYPHHGNAATFHGFGKYFFRFRIDYIFVPPYVRVRDAKIIHLRRKKCYPSDHFPLLTHIDLPARVASVDARAFSQAL